MELIHGLTAATYTPTHDDGLLNTDILEDYAEHLAKADVKGIFICGTTGESLSFTMKERIDLMEAWCPVAMDHGLKVIFHVGSACQIEAIEMSKAAMSAGADIIAAMAPPCITPESVGDLVEFMKPIAKACGETPFLFYDNPSRSHVDFSPNLVLGEMMASIDNFAGVKLTRCDLESLEQAIDTCGDEAQVFFACDQMLLFGLQLGDLIAFATITETIFSWPGMGKLLIDSIYRADRPVIVVYLMLVALIFVVINFLVDIVYTLIDPRITLK